MLVPSPSSTWQLPHLKPDPSHFFLLPIRYFWRIHIWCNHSLLKMPIICMMHRASCDTYLPYVPMNTAIYPSQPSLEAPSYFVPNTRMWHIARNQPLTLQCSYPSSLLVKEETWMSLLFLGNILWFFSQEFTFILCVHSHLNHRQVYSLPRIINVYLFIFSPRHQALWFKFSSLPTKWVCEQHMWYLSY